MNISYASSFIKQLERLPKDIQRSFLKQQTILQGDWQDSRLHPKQLKGKPTTFSIRITRVYRALFYLRSTNSIIFYAIGHRKDIYR